MSKSKEKKLVYLGEIARLKKKRRKDVLKCALALGLIVLVLMGKQAFIMNGIDLDQSLAFGAFEMVATIGLAVLGGLSSIDYTKSGNMINALKQARGITDDQIREYMSAK